MPSDRYELVLQSAVGNQQGALFDQLYGSLFFWGFFFRHQVIRDYTTPPNEELSRDLFNRLKPYIRYRNHLPGFTG